MMGEWGLIHFLSNKSDAVFFWSYILSIMTRMKAARKLNVQMATEKQSGTVRLPESEYK